jgi:hypothetical protein
MAAGALRAQPFYLRRIMHNFLPYNRAISKSLIHGSCCWVADGFQEKHYSDATRIILPEVEKRKLRAEKVLAAGGKPPITSDTIGWMVEMARGKHVDYVAAQLSLTVAAIHATTEALTCALADLVTHPDTIPQLRKEMIQVVGEEGWSKQTLYKLKLLDSFLKESQRMHPVRLQSSTNQELMC